MNRTRVSASFIAAGVVGSAQDLFQFYLPIYGHSIGLSASVIGTVIISKLGTPAAEGRALAITGVGSSLAMFALGAASMLLWSPGPREHPRHPGDDDKAAEYHRRQCRYLAFKFELPHSLLEASLKVVSSTAGFLRVETGVYFAGLFLKLEFFGAVIPVVDLFC